MQVLSYTVLADGWLPGQLGGFVDTATIAAGISSFAPIVVAWITKKQASDRVKAVINLLAVAVASVIALIINGTNDGSPLSWQLIVSTFIAGLIASISAFKGVWKPLGITGSVANASQDFGVGKPVPAVLETARPADGGVTE